MRLSSIALGFLLGAVLFISLSIVVAWTGPTAPPPAGNVAAPLNVGTTDQIKEGGLGLDALAVFGNAIISGTSRYLNFGFEPGEAGYGIRDNAGTMEFKDDAGVWRSFLPSTDVESIQFADGTTQTTAAGTASNGTVGGGCDGKHGWGNALNCKTQPSCSSSTLSGSCPSGYTVRQLAPTAVLACQNSSSCGKRL